MLNIMNPKQRPYSRINRKKSHREEHQESKLRPVFKLDIISIDELFQDEVDSAKGT
jgi:hypothetical protein